MKSYHTFNSTIVIKGIVYNKESRILAYQQQGTLNRLCLRRLIMNGIKYHTNKLNREKESKGEILWMQFEEMLQEKKWNSDAHQASSLDFWHQQPKIWDAIGFCKFRALPTWLHWNDKGSMKNRSIWWRKLAIIIESSFTDDSSWSSNQRIDTRGAGSASPVVSSKISSSL